MPKRVTQLISRLLIVGRIEPVVYMIGDKSNLSNYREVNGLKVVFGGESSGQTK